MTQPNNPTGISLSAKEKNIFESVSKKEKKKEYIRIMNYQKREAKTCLLRVKIL